MGEAEDRTTLGYYAGHAQEYFERTAGVDMSSVYVPFEAHLHDNSRILDLGTGSGVQFSSWERSLHRGEDDFHATVLLSPLSRLVRGNRPVHGVPGNREAIGIHPHGPEGPSHSSRAGRGEAQVVMINSSGGLREGLVVRMAFHGFLNV